jgi:hypothetical protein
VQDQSDGDKKENRWQNQGKKKAPVTKVTTSKKILESQKKPGQSEKRQLGSAAPASIAKESQADRDGRGQAVISQPAGSARSSRTNAKPARALRPGGGAYRRRDSLLQPPISRDYAARVRHFARW